jgi:hypothetical protein
MSRRPSWARRRRSKYTGGEATYARVLVALDGPILAEQAIPQAERVLAPGGLITLARVVEPALVLPSAGSVDYVAQRGSQQLVDHVRRGTDRPRAEAASHLGEARRVAESLDSPVLSEKIRLALEPYGRGTARAPSAA